MSQRNGDKARFDRQRKKNLCTANASRFAESAGTAEQINTRALTSLRRIQRTLHCSEASCRGASLHSLISETGSRVRDDVLRPTFKGDPCSDYGSATLTKVKV
jgi:hypothetical protein